MKYFVRDGSVVSKVRNATIEKYLKMGCRKKTPLNSKPLVDYSVENNRISQIKIYVPDTEHFLDENRKEIVFDFDPELRPKLVDMQEMLLPVEDFLVWEGENMEARYITDCIASFQQACINHGERISMVDNGFIADPNPFLRESGSNMARAKMILKEAIKNT